MGGWALGGVHFVLVGFVDAGRSAVDTCLCLAGHCQHTSVPYAWWYTLVLAGPTAACAS